LAEPRRFEAKRNIQKIQARAGRNRFFILWIPLLVFNKKMPLFNPLAKQRHVKNYVLSRD